RRPPAAFGRTSSSWLQHSENLPENPLGRDQEREDEEDEGRIPQIVLLGLAKHHVVLLDFLVETADLVHREELAARGAGGQLLQGPDVQDGVVVLAIRDEDRELRGRPRRLVLVARPYPIEPRVVRSVLAGVISVFRLVLVQDDLDPLQARPAR